MPLLFGLTLGCALGAQRGKIDQVIAELEKVQSFANVTISPDGQWVSWVEAAAPGKDKDEIYLWHRSETGAKPERLPASDGSGPSGALSGLAWSPDSGRMAWLESGSNDQAQVVTAKPGGKTQRLTHVKGHVSALHWSPDGTQISFLYAENGGGGGPLEAVAAQTGVIGSELHNQRLALIGLGEADLRQVSPATLNIYEYDWAPDGRRFAAIAAPGPADNNWWTAQLYVGDIQTGRMKAAYKPPPERQLASPRWSPDSKRIAFIGGLMSDEGFLGGDVFLIPAEGGEARNLAPKLKASPSGLTWQRSDELLFTETVDGGGAIGKLTVGSGETEMLWKGDEALHQDGNFPNLAIARDGRTSAVIRSSWAHAPEVWAGALGEWRPVTHANAAQTAHWGKAESLTWVNDGFRQQGWLIYPEHFDPAKRYPMVVEIHGGPASAKSAAWPSTHFDLSVMAGLEYFVFFPNPRGSYGSGEAFTKANVRDFGYGDLRDVLRGVDTVLKRAPVDEQRLGISGWSYGGYMTMWTVTQTNRFRAAVAGAGIANWLSYYGENSIDAWMIPYFGASVYDDPAVYAKSSPMSFIKKVKTPTLVVVGERDGECPAPQSFEFWHALKTLGVPSKLVVYPGEGHSFRQARNRVDVLRQTLAWFDKYLGQAPAE